MNNPAVFCVNFIETPYTWRFYPLFADEIYSSRVLQNGPGMVYN